MRTGAETGVILQVAVAFAEAKAYRDCPTDPGGHYDVWITWRRLRATGSQRCGIPPAMRKHEYENVPAAASFTGNLIRVSSSTPTSAFDPRHLPAASSRV